MIGRGGEGHWRDVFFKGGPFASGFPQWVLFSSCSCVRQRGRLMHGCISHMHDGLRCMHSALKGGNLTGAVLEQKGHSFIEALCPL